MNYTLVIAAALVLFMFLSSGVHKIMTFAKQSQQFARKFGISLVLGQVVISAVILLEVLAPLIIVQYGITGQRFLQPLAELGLLGLIVFTVLCNALYHWPATGSNYYSFMSNLSTIGGLILLYILMSGAKY
jgi:uncharacterized membrane protein YphA (DoxX/SURF4 family)